ncbi:HEPN domain-containing protein [uncultured Psychrobacter sp.]|uniref:ApeA N-terminal domain 1-containing protein n=1 Tax=uncultured Psychrobacter sp. TaxID=259303 RepID=UPI0034594BF1
MKLAKTIVEKGYFWLDDKQEDKIQGTLKIDKNGEILLELFGEISGSSISLINSDKIDYYHVNGIIDNKYITLTGCYTRKFKMLFPSGFHEALVSANMAILGVGYSSDEELLFKKVTFSFSDADEWFNISGIDKKILKNDEGGDLGYQLHYTPQEPIIFELLDGYSLEVKSKASVNDMDKTHLNTIRENIVLSISSDDNKPLDEFTEQIFKLGQFLSFMTGKLINLDSLNGFSKILDSENNETSAKQDIYYSSVFNSNESSSSKVEEPLLRFTKIRSINPEFFKNWMAAYEALSPALALYFAYHLGAYRFLDSKFLALAQGLETLHRRTSSELSMSESDFEEMLSEIIDNCPTAHKDWLRMKLHFANELSLRKRLQDLFEPYSDLFGSKKDMKHVIGKIVTTRNYLTHYSLDLKEQASTGSDLFKIVKSMEALFTIHFLAIIGMDKKDVIKTTKTSPILMRQFRYIKS